MGEMADYALDQLSDLDELSLEHQYCGAAGCSSWCSERREDSDARPERTKWASKQPDGSLKWIEFKDMTDAHLANALRQLAKRGASPGRLMIEEGQRRGLDLFGFRP